MVGSDGDVSVRGDGVLWRVCDVSMVYDSLVRLYSALFM